MTIQYDPALQQELEEIKAFYAARADGLGIELPCRVLAFGNSGRGKSRTVDGRQRRFAENYSPAFPLRGLFSDDR